MHLKKIQNKYKLETWEVRRGRQHISATGITSDAFIETLYMECPMKNSHTLVLHIAYANNII